MTNALAIYDQMAQITTAATALQKSGYFSDAKSEAQAIVKVMAGAEAGLPPFASMSGIHVIQGKPTFGANLIATLIKQHPNYNYRVLEMTDTVCRIQFFEHGEKCGVSEFTAQDAKRAQVKNMNKFPKNMLFARAISNGSKWFCPDVFGGAPAYTPDEMGADVDENGNAIIDVTPTVEPPAQEAQPEPKTHNGSFIGYVMSKLDYYRAEPHVKNTMAKLGIEHPQSKDAAKAAFEALERYAAEREAEEIDATIAGEIEPETIDAELVADDELAF